MSLRASAIELVLVLQRVIQALEAFKHPYGASYAYDMANRLRPLVTDFDRAVTIEKSRDQASNILSDIIPLMHNINGASTKGDLAIFPNYSDRTLERFWDLKTIFQEGRYSNEAL